MDDFEYSVHISDSDWDAFFHECQECDLPAAALARPDDSGTSDADDGASSRAADEEEEGGDEPPEQAGLPLERYLSACRHPGPEDLLSCSEEDTHLESINMFFEKLRSVEGGRGGSLHAESEPKETWREVCNLEEPAEELLNRPQVPQAKSQSNSSAPGFSVAAKQDRVGSVIPTGGGEKDLHRAGKPLELSSEEDDALAEPAVELFIREEDCPLNVERMQEKEGDLTKEESPKAALSPEVTPSLKATSSLKVAPSLKVTPSAKVAPSPKVAPSLKVTPSPKVPPSSKAAPSLKTTPSLKDAAPLKVSAPSLKVGVPSVKAAPSCPSFSNDACGLRRQPSMEESQSSTLTDMSGREHRAGEGTEAIQSRPFLKEASSSNGHQVELQTHSGAVLSEDTVNGAEGLTVKSENEQKEERYVATETGRENSSSLSVKKKRKRVRNRGAPLATGQAFEGQRGGTKSEKQEQVFEQEAAGPRGVVFDGRACEDKADSERKGVPVYQMTHSSGTVPRGSELPSTGCGIEGPCADSHTAERDRDFEESVTRPKDYSEENIPTFANQQRYRPEHDFQNHSLQIHTPASNTEIENPTACDQPDNGPERLQSGGAMIQYDPVSPQSSGLSGIESRNGSEHFPLTAPEGFNITEESSSDQGIPQNKPTLPMNSPKDDHEVCELSHVLLETPSSTDAPQCNQPIICGTNGTVDSRNQNIPEHEQEVTCGQGLPTFSQEIDTNIVRNPEISPPKEFTPMLNTTDLPAPTRTSPSLDKVSGHGPSSCDELCPMDIQCPDSDEEEGPTGYQEVEELYNEPCHCTMSQCQAETETGNTGPETSCAASKNEKPSVVIKDKALPCQTSKLTDTQMLIQPDLAPAPLSTYTAVNGLSVNLTGSSVAGDGNGSSVKPITQPDTDHDNSSKTDDWLQEKSEHLPRTSSVECGKNPPQALIDILPVNEEEAEFEPELESKRPLDTPALHTLEAKIDGREECEPSLPRESAVSDDKAIKPLEVEESNKQPETKRPVHTMSAFWRDMEKLTINDILYLRSAGDSPRGLPRSSLPTDASDAGAPGYSSPLGDSGHDLPSADMSIIPDSNEECSLSCSAGVKSSLGPGETKTPGRRSLGLFNTRSVSWESESSPADPGTDNATHETPTLYSGDSVTPPLLTDQAHQGLRRMCKNVSVQNLRALGVEPRAPQGSRASLGTTAIEEEVLQESNGTLQKPEETCTPVPLESRSTLKPSVASSLPGDEATEGYGMYFREIFGYFFGAREAGVHQADMSRTPEVHPGDGASVPEMYDYFFAEFEEGNFFFPSIRDTGGRRNESVAAVPDPSPSNRNLQFPEAYDYFFPDSSSSDSDGEGDGKGDSKGDSEGDGEGYGEGDGEEDGEEDRRPIRVVRRFGKSTGEPAVDTEAGADMYEHFLTDDWGESLFWGNTLSLRRMRFMGVTRSKEGPASRVLVEAVQQGRAVVSTILTLTESAGDFHHAVSPRRPLYCLEEQIFRELEDRQRRHTDPQTTIAVPTDPSLLPFRHSDMCLICISLASWVLKTANPQDSEAWKAALLANISALSAIRYLRRYIRYAANER